MLASRDPQALAELARQLGVSEAQSHERAGEVAGAGGACAGAGDGCAESRYQRPSRQAGAEASRRRHFPPRLIAHLNPPPMKTWRGSTREAIDRTLSSTLPEGIGEGARRRIGDDVFRELHATLSADRELSRQVGEILRGWRFDGATRQQIVSLISGRARAAMPEVARRVVGEWTSSVLASDRARAARVDAAASRRDITGGRLPEPVPASALRPRNIDYSRMSDEQILEL